MQRLVRQHSEVVVRPSGYRLLGPSEFPGGLTVWIEPFLCGFFVTRLVVCVSPNKNKTTYWCPMFVPQPPRLIGDDLALIQELLKLWPILYILQSQQNAFLGLPTEHDLGLAANCLLLPNVNSLPENGMKVLQARR